MKKIFNIIGKTVKVIFIVFCVYLVSLFFHAQRLPQSAVEALSRRLSVDDVVFHCERASFGFRDGLLLEGVKVFDRSCKDPMSSIVSAASVSLRLFLRTMEIRALRYDRLPAAYYDPAPIQLEEPGQVSAALTAMRLPRLSGWRLVLVAPKILGLEPRRLEARFESETSRLELEDIGILWPNEENDMSLYGRCAIDLREARVDGFVRGTATQPLIRPFLVALDIPSSYPYVDGFTGVEGPVKSYCGWNVNLLTRAFRIDLTLEPRMGRYNGVPLRTAVGDLAFNVSFAQDGRMDFRHTIGPIHATDRESGRLDGTISVTRTNGVFSLGFDATSTLAKEDVLDIMDYLNDGSLDCLKCKTPPTFTARGTIHPDGPSAANDLAGRVAFAEGSLFGIPLHDVSATYLYRGEAVSFSNAVARGRRGGRLSGSAALNFSADAPDASTFELGISYRDGYSDEIADAFPFDFGERRGRIDADVRFSGPLSTNALAGLNGAGTVKVQDGHIAQMKLFAGLTQLLAENVPGVATIVNQSNLHGSFVITNGVIMTHDAVIDGSAILSIYLDGSYDMVRDVLDFNVQARAMRDENVIAKYVLRPVLWPFSKLLMDFRLTGSANEPKWKSITLLDRFK